MNDNEKCGNGKCDLFEQRIQWLFDERLPLGNDSILVNHADQCVDCAHLLADYRLLASSLNLPTERSLMRRGSKSSRWTASQVSPNFISLLICIAALLLVTVGLFVNKDREPGPDRSDLVAINFSPVSAVAQSNDARSNIPTIQSVSAKFRDSDVLGNESIGESICDYSPSLLGLARSTPRLVRSVSFRSNPLEKISTKLDPLNPYFRYSNELPGIRPLQNSVNIAVDLLQRSWSKPVKLQPDLGRFSDLTLFVAV